jgi:hypothetical protein
MARIQMLHEAGGGPAFARRVMTSRCFSFLHPGLQFDELDLERELLPLVLLAFMRTA